MPANEVLAVAGEQARSFDAPGAEFAQRNGKGTFEVLIEAFDLGGDPALTRLARVSTRPTSWTTWTAIPSVRASPRSASGGLDVEHDDHRLLERGGWVYDALYAWCVRDVV